MKVRNVEKKIFAEHRNLSGTSEIDSKYKYVKLARGLPTFGVHFFLVKVGEHDFNLRHCPRNRLFLNPSLSPSWPFYCKFLLVQCSESLCPVKRLKTFEFNNKMTQKSQLKKVLIAEKVLQDAMFISKSVAKEAYLLNARCRVKVNKMALPRGPIEPFSRWQDRC